MHVVRTESDREKFHKIVDATPLPFLGTLRRGGTRTLSQNAYLWGVVYPRFTEQLEGFTREDVHEYMLGECFGWEELEGFGRKRLKPIQRSSSLSKMEFMDYVAFIQQKGAEMGIDIPEPE